MPCSNDSTHLLRKGWLRIWCHAMCGLMIRVVSCDNHIKYGNSHGALPIKFAHGAPHTNIQQSTHDHTTSNKFYFDWNAYAFFSQTHTNDRVHCVIWHHRERKNKNMNERKKHNAMASFQCRTYFTRNNSFQAHSHFICISLISHCDTWIKTLNAWQCSKQKEPTTTQ